LFKFRQRAQPWGPFYRSEAMLEFLLSLFTGTDENPRNGWA
jgi:hypothetical protein